jgi:hypothetical protein
VSDQQQGETMSGAKRYQKRPVVIEAIQLKWATWPNVCEFLGGIISQSNPAWRTKEYSDTCGEVGPEWIALKIPTPEGDMIARHGDWIIKGVKGEFYPCKPDIFAATYDEVGDV